MKKLILSAIWLVLFSQQLQALALVVVASANATTVCNGAGTVVALNATATGGTPGYTFQWSPTTGLSSSTVQAPLCQPTMSTNYCVTVTDQSASTASACIQITVDSVHIDSFEVTGSAPAFTQQVFVSGGVPPYSYVWSNSASTSSSIVTSAGTYRVTVNDADGCNVTGADTIHSGITYFYDSTLVGTPWFYCANQYYDTALLITVHAPIYGTATKVDVGNQVCIEYTPAYNFVGYDTFSMQICGLGMCDTPVVVMKVYSNCYQCVWPGDANYDDVADNNDLLPIGIAYGTTGPVRNNATLNWVGQAAPYWPDSLTDNTNYKHVDCNGDGLIDANDTMAIMLNYGQTHSRGWNGSPERGLAPPIYPQITTDTFSNGDNLTVQIMLGDSANPATNVYGLAFTLNYDVAIADTTKTTTTFGDSWLGTSADKISINKDLKQTGQVQCGLTRIDHVTRSGWGQIGAIILSITTDNLNGKNYSYYNAAFSISKVTIIDSVGNLLPFSTSTDSVVVAYTPTGINDLDNLNNLIQVFPNPAKDNVLVKSKQAGIQQIKVVDILGNQVMLQSFSNASNISQASLNVALLSAGTYFVEVFTAKGISHQQLIIAK